MGELSFYKDGDVRHSMGRLLSEIKPKGKIFVGSAGALVYYSKWESYDAWGLATKDFSKQIALPEAVAKYQPDLIQVRYCRSAIFDASEIYCLNVSKITSKKERNFSYMECNIFKGALTQGYEPFIWLGKPRQYFFFVRRDSPLYDKILHKFQSYYPKGSIMPYCQYAKKMNLEYGEIKF